MVHWGRTPPPAGFPPRTLPEGVPPLPPILVPPPAPAGHGSSGSGPCFLELFPLEAHCGCINGQLGWDRIPAAAAAVGVGRLGYLQAVCAGSAAGRRPPSASSSGEVVWRYVPDEQQQQVQQLQLGLGLLPRQSVSTQRLLAQLRYVEQEQPQPRLEHTWSNGAPVQPWAAEEPPVRLPKLRHQQWSADVCGNVRPEAAAAAVARSSSGTVFSPVSAQALANALTVSHKGPAPAAVPGASVMDAGGGGSRCTGDAMAHAADGRWGAQRRQGPDGQLVVLDLSAARGSNGRRFSSPEVPASPFTTDTPYAAAIFPRNPTAAATAAAAAATVTGSVYKQFPRAPGAGTPPAAPPQPPHQTVTAPGAAPTAEGAPALPAVDPGRHGSDGVPATAALAASALADAAVPRAARSFSPLAALFPAPAAASSSMDSILNGLPIQIGGQDVDSDIMQMLWDDLNRHPWPWQAEAATAASHGVASAGSQACAPFATDTDGAAAYGSDFLVRQHQAAAAQQQQQKGQRQQQQQQQQQEQQEQEHEQVQQSEWYRDLGLPPMKRPCLELQLSAARGSLPATHGSLLLTRGSLGAALHGTARVSLGAGTGVGLSAMVGMGGAGACVRLAADVANGRGVEEGIMGWRAVGDGGGISGACAPVLLG